MNVLYEKSGFLSIKTSGWLPEIGGAGSLLYAVMNNGKSMYVNLDIMGSCLKEYGKDGGYREYLFLNRTTKPHRFMHITIQAPSLVDEIAHAVASDSNWEAIVNRIEQGE